MTRVAVAGFQHETNTFSPVPTRFEDFESAGAWPELTRGAALPPRVRGMNLPIAGFIEACRHEAVPLLWAAAEPGGYVEDDAFDRISCAIAQGIAESGADAAYLDLHGAMVTRRHEDGEAEILRRVRSRAGPDFPIVVSLDLHGNLSREFFDLATAVTVYRTYPHVDIADTGARAAALLDRALAGRPLFGSFRQVDLLIPITAQSTLHSPAREIYAMLGGLGAVSADVCLGFPPADVPCCGPSVFCYAETRERADRAADEIVRAIEAAEPCFDSRLTGVEEAVAAALAAKSGTVVIADPQDNPGAGATGDTTGLLRALLDAGAEDAALSMIHDPDSAAAAHAAGLGSELCVEIGGRHRAFSEPVRAEATVAALAEGPFWMTGPMFGGSRADLGRIARLDIKGTGVSVVVGSRRAQNADQEMFRVVGIEPRDRRVVCVKSAVHFLADYGDIADQVLFAESPGANVCRLDRIRYRNLRPNMRRL